MKKKKPWFWRYVVIDEWCDSGKKVGEVVVFFEDPG